MTIRAKLIVFFLAFTIIPIVILGFVSLNELEKMVRQSAIEQVDTLANTIIRRIDNFLDDRRRMVAATCESGVVRRNLPALDREQDEPWMPDYFSALREIDATLGAQKTALGYLNILLLSPEGRLVYAADLRRNSIDLGELYPDPSGGGWEAARQRITLLQPPTHLSATNYKVFCAGPVRDDAGKLLGIAAVEVNVHRLFSLFSDVSLVQHSGEILTAKRVINQVHFLSSLKYATGLELTADFRPPPEIFPAQEAVLGRNGFGPAMDYRGQPVLAAWRHLPALNWGLVVKIDQAEILTPVRNLRRVIVGIGFVIAAASALLSVLLSQMITRPIRELQEGARQIGAGNLNVILPVRSRDEIAQLRGSFNDMTSDLKTAIAKREQAEADLTQHAVRLEQANQELEAFSYSVSHDLRAPLRAIVGFSDILRQEYAARLDDEGRRYLDVIIASTKNMGTLIDDILTLSRLGRREMRMLPVSIEQLARETFSERMREYPGRKVELKLGPLPPALGDHNLLRQVMTNLISNAIKFAANSESAVIELGGRAEGDTVTYYVRDNGVGFNMKYVDKLFGVFQRLHGPEFEGTGIGLAIVQRVIRRHGGKVWAEGKVGEGATFYFSLPAATSRAGDGV